MKGTGPNLVDVQQPDYQSFLLRVWRNNVDEPWRGSLHSTATNEVCHFDSLLEMFVCLDKELAKLNSVHPSIQVIVEPDPP